MLINDVTDRLSISLCLINDNGNIIDSNNSFKKTFKSKENIFDIINEDIHYVFKDAVEKKYLLSLKSKSKRNLIKNKESYYDINIIPVEKNITLLEFIQKTPEIIRKKFFDDDIKNLNKANDLRKELFNTFEYMLLQKKEPWVFVQEISKRITNLQIVEYLKIEYSGEKYIYGNFRDTEEIFPLTITHEGHDINIFYMTKENITIEMKMIILTFINFIKLYVDFYEEFEKSRLYDTQLFDSEKFSMAGQMMVGMLHEINNPLTVAMLQTDMLIKKEENTEKLQKIKMSLSRIKEITEIFRSALKQEKNISEFSIKKLIKTAADFILPKKPTNLKIEIEHQLKDFTIEGDFNKLVLVFINLISNSMDAINKSYRQEGIIRIKSFDYKDKVVIKVSDNGEGMSEEVLKNIFKPFYTTKARSGLGYGLFFVSTICSSHNIKVSVISREKSGTTFTLLVPRKQEVLQ